MSLIIRSKNINQINKKIILNLNESIPFLKVLLMKNNNLNQSVIDSRSNIMLFLKLLDLENNIVDSLNLNYITMTNQGIGIFEDIKINQIGEYLLVVEDINNFYKSDSVNITVRDKIINYAINLVNGSDKILKYNSEIYTFNILDERQQMITSLNTYPLPSLNLFISYFLKPKNNEEELISLQIKPNKDGYYNFRFSGSEIMGITIKLSIDKTIYINNITISDFSFNLNVVDYISENNSKKYPVINNRRLSFKTNHLNSNYDFSLSEDIYTRRQIWVNNQLFKGRPSKELINFETSLNCSEQLNYSLKQPQELFSIPQKVDNSIGSVVKGIPYFNPKTVFNN